MLHLSQMFCRPQAKYILYVGYVIKHWLPGAERLSMILSEIMQSSSQCKEPAPASLSQFLKAHSGDSHVFVV